MPKILAINDRKDNLVALTALLANLMPGCEVMTALSGPEGVEKARTGQPDVILLDVQMPDADFVYDADGQFIEVNPVAVQRYGYSRDEFLNMTVRDLCAPDLLDQVENRLRQALTDGLRIRVAPPMQGRQRDPR